MAVDALEAVRVAAASWPGGEALASATGELVASATAGLGTAAGALHPPASVTALVSALRLVVEELAAAAPPLPSPPTWALTPQALKSTLLDGPGPAPASLLVAAASLGATLGLTFPPLPTAPEQLPYIYDPEANAAYFARRPQLLLQRQLSLAGQSLAFAAALLGDKQSGRWEANMPVRAAQLRALIVAQGAAFIKVGQAVAIRPDILPPPYLEELAKLLDAVPPFEALEAQEALRAALAAKGLTPEAVFTDTSAFTAPVAAASIGQVYRATLRADGTQVAVKLQRPNILQAVALDLHILRRLALDLGRSPVQSVRIQASAFVEVLDTAAARFWEELDYEGEAANASRFGALMAASAAGKAIRVPRCFTELSSRGVLVQEWVTGVKLNDPSLAGDSATRGRLVRTLLLSYMVQLLETGFLHADPHPGNFLLLEDGRVCILDYGMMTTVTADQRLSFLEYMSHLSARQYDQTLDDLVRLGFVPPELAADPAKRAVVAPAIASTLEILYGAGGGLSGAKVEALRDQSRIAALSEELKEISRRYPVRLPPYFVLILRAFGTLEGLGLGVDGGFAILDECFPYVARRLLTDDSPRVRAALRTFVYGGEQRLSVARVESIAAGFRTFASTMAPEAAPAAAAPAQLDAATSEVLGVLLAEEGNYVQELVLDESVRLVDALSREATLSLWAAATGAAAGPLAALLPPWARAPPLRLSEEDAEALALLRRLSQLFVPAGPPNSAPADPTRDVQAAVAAARAMAPLAPALAPGLAALGRRFATMLAARALRRAAEDVAAFGLTPVSRELAPPPVPQLTAR